jgi:outer membrane lipoprotein-sorting protein
MRRLIAALLCSLAFGASAQDSDLLERVMGELSAHPSVRAEFTQSRENLALAQAQQSQGQLVFVAGHGMLWQVTQPYRETLALTGTRTARIDDKGQLQIVRGGDRGVAQVSQMLQSMLTGNPEEALRQFNVETRGTTSQWTMRFTPRQERMARVLLAIELNGNQFLQGIRIEMQNGEATQIRFSGTRDAGTLSPLELRALGIP